MLKCRWWEVEITRDIVTSYLQLVECRKCEQGSQKYSNLFSAWSQLIKINNLDYHTKATRPIRWMAESTPIQNCWITGPRSKPITTAVRRHLAHTIPRDPAPQTHRPPSVGTMKSVRAESGEAHEHTGDGDRRRHGGQADRRARCRERAVASYHFLLSGLENNHRLGLVAESRKQWSQQKL